MKPPSIAAAFTASQSIPPPGVRPLRNLPACRFRRNLGVMSPGPKQTDFTSRNQTIGIAFLLFVILGVWEVVGQVFSPWLLLANGAVALAIGWLVQRLTLWEGTGLVDTMHGGGHIEAPPSYSLQESMIVRGRYEDAAEAFRNH